MTTAEIEYILNLVGEQTDAVSPMLSLSYIVIDKLENLYINLDCERFKFDTENGLLYRYKCREYNGYIPSDWKEGKNYDSYNDKTYKYLFNPDTLEPYVDIFEFANVVTISLKIVSE